MTEFSVVIIEPRNDRERQIQEAYRDVRGPLPPFNELKHANIYWLAYVDGDKRIWPSAPFQWEPVSKQWCQVGDVATGKPVDLTGYIVVGPCIRPETGKVHFTSSSIIVEHPQG
ncbi:hypothetical protein [Pseudomonas amygdali]|uniref:Uncharacterized protein n=2 Tax=Pseudomonas amygdali pv. lachrymans TaxID=53707 RepID=A0ABR5KT04_PSEAV|nr:hypothetical protein [Pseudomonas amygdali]AXH59561.1 hypothetical protein PLA107_030515 [Pseudomonas amygdali pv. lachrymans str. M301315]KPC16988.1 Uncharacterized protein AC499_0190 [Pseudomonas amygdali pv. lachrymans]KPC17947.1 Uncharacterized protein AC499_1149 [Pseudomonas amygdali pv. lachrymans]